MLTRCVWGLVLALSLVLVRPDTVAAEVAGSLVEPTSADELLAAEFEEDLLAPTAGYADPLELLNRGTLGLNRRIDRWVLDPLVTVYEFVLPMPARRSVRNFFDNLDSPVVFANDVLQREWTSAGTTVTRFGINSTVGLLGLFDPATSFGYDKHISDFGQTMALEGVPAGAYLVLPLLGPTTLRDGVGDIVDMVFRPTTFLLPAGQQIVYTTIYGSSYGIATRSEVAKDLAVLEESSVDYYAALRSAYYQSRTAEVWDGRSEHRSLMTIAGDWSDVDLGWRAMTPASFDAAANLPLPR